MPASLEMKFIPPHPFSVNMPLEHSMKAESISGIYGKVKCLTKYGVELSRITLLQQQKKRGRQLLLGLSDHPRVTTT